MEKNNQNNIDKKVQESLHNYEVPFNPDHWDKMEQRLKQLDAEEAAFDASLRERMAQREIPFNELHWELMNEKIEQELSWKAKIVRFKVIELALMLLVLFTVINIIDTEGAENNGNIPSSVTPNKLKSENTEKGIKTFNNSTDWRNRTRIQPKTESKTPDNNSVPIVSVERNNDVKNNGTSTQKFDIVSSANSYQLGSKESSTSKIATMNNAENSNSTAVNTSDIASIESSTTLTKMEPLAEMPTRALTTLNFDNNKELIPLNIQAVNNTIVDVVASTEEVAPLSILRPKALSITEMVEGDILPKPARKNKWWQFGIFGSGNVDMSSVAYQYKEDSGKGHDWSLNKGLGISLSRKKGKIEIETGLVYSEKRYKTQLPESILRGPIFSGKAEEILLPKSVDMGVLQLPLSINNTLTSFGRWEIYTSLGASANMAMRLNADYYEAPPSATTSLQKRSDSETDKLPAYDKAFEIPFIRNNKNNYYFTAHAGVGVAYRLSTSTSIFAQPSYEKQFGGYGIGTMRDKINTLSIHAGLKMKIDKN